MNEVHYFKWCRECRKVTEHEKDYKPFVDRPPNLFCLVCNPGPRLPWVEYHFLGEPASLPVDKVDEALTEIAMIAKDGRQEFCPICGQKQGYLFYGAKVREILRKLVKS